MQSLVGLCLGWLNKITQSFNYRLYVFTSKASYAFLACFKSAELGLREKLDAFLLLMIFKLCRRISTSLALLYSSFSTKTNRAFSSLMHPSLAFTSIFSSSIISSSALRYNPSSAKQSCSHKSVCHSLIIFSVLS